MLNGSIKFSSNFFEIAQHFNDLRSNQRKKKYNFFIQENVFNVPAMKYLASIKHTLNYNQSKEIVESMRKKTFSALTTFYEHFR